MSFAKRESITKLLENFYAIAKRQMTVTIRAEGEPGFLQVSFIWPSGDRLAADREKQRKAKEAAAKRKVSSVAAGAAAP